MLFMADIVPLDTPPFSAKLPHGHRKSSNLTVFRGSPARADADELLVLECEVGAPVVRCRLAKLSDIANILAGFLSGNSRMMTGTDLSFSSLAIRRRLLPREDDRPSYPSPND